MTGKRKSASLTTWLMTGLMLVMAAVILLVTELVSTRFVDAMTSQYNDNAEIAFSVAEGKLDALMEDTLRSVASLKSNQNINVYLSRDWKDNIEHVEARREFLSVIRSEMINHPQIEGVLFFRSDGSACGLISDWTVFTDETAHSLYKSRIGDLPDGKRGLVWLGPLRKSQIRFFIGDLPEGRETTFCALNQYQYAFSGRGAPETLTVMVCIRPESFDECLSVLQDGVSRVALVDAEGNVLVGEADALRADELAFASQSPAANANRTAVIDASDEGGRQVIARTTGKYPWSLLKSLSLSVYRTNIWTLRQHAYQIGGAAIALTALASFLWIRLVNGPFRLFQRVISKVSAGDIRLRMPEYWRVREFAPIAAQFNLMLDSIGELLERTRADERERTRLELQNLRMRLNPHMIFNSISAMRWMASMQGAEKVSDMLAELAELLRPVFTLAGQWWTLNTEMEYTGHYIALLRLRFGTVLRFETKIDPALTRWIAPSFSLQPLIENCCEHGLGSRDTLHVTILAKRTAEDEMTLSVIDDGRGIAPERLKAIRALLSGANAENAMTGVGLYAIHRRAQLLCGDAYGLIVASEEGKGSEISIRLKKTVDIACENSTSLS